MKIDDTEPQVVQLEKRDVFLAALALAIFAVSLILNVTTTLLLIGGAQQAAIDHAANCSYQHYLKDQLHDSRMYLKLHPEGAPALGISATQIQLQIERQTAAVHALSDLNCG